MAMEQAIAFLRGGVTQGCGKQACAKPPCDDDFNPVVAVIGPAKSSTTIAVQNLLQVFRIPQLGKEIASVFLFLFLQEVLVV